MKPLIERFEATPFVLLHCYPYVRKAGWLAHGYAKAPELYPLAATWWREALAEVLGDVLPARLTPRER